MGNLTMKYRTPAPDSAEGWENESLPIGNGYLGANIFGIVNKERIQLTHNALVNPHYDECGRMFGGLNNLAEIYIYFPCQEVDKYERGLSLDEGFAYCNYYHKGIKFTREYFASYPDKVIVTHIEADKKEPLNFKIVAEIPYIKEYAFKEGDGGGKSGSVWSLEDTIFFRGTLHFYNVLFEGLIKVITDGVTVQCENGICIENATQATIVIAADTNYALCEEVFLEQNREKKTKGTDPHESMMQLVSSAVKKGYQKLREQHMQDYRKLFGRVKFSLDDSKEGYVEDLLCDYKSGKSVPYLEELYFQYGRYLLISSSRKGGLPANLQGIWNCHDLSPWGSGYWHNINVQMNYWPAFNTNLLETFEPYVDYHQAYRSKAEEYASEYIKEHNPKNFKEGKGACGWTIGTAGYPYFITAPGGHSGPGTGALTSKLFWEAYAFSCDPQILKEVTYPALLGMSRFLTKTVKEYDGKYLVCPSASPEQLNNGPYISDGTFYRTVGCAFDQQLIYENGKDLLTATDLLGADLEEKEDIVLQKQQIDKYSHVNVGWSGQIKEFLEEHFYGEIGEYHHRHISHLMALYPGTSINASTPAWMDAARISLENRGNNTTGWALAHRLNAWARLGEGNKAYEVIRKLLSEKTMMNLWDLHPPFQIDGNFGATAGIAEMLMQSHNDHIEILPALPDTWESGSFEGLLARGGFEIDARWNGGSITYIRIKSLCGNGVKIKCPGIGMICRDDNRYQVLSDDLIQMDTVKDGCYLFENLPPKEKVDEVEELSIEVGKEMTLSWKSNNPVNVYRAIDSASDYQLLAEDVIENSYKDTIDFSKHETITYKVKAVRGTCESKGIYKTINHATELEIDRYEILLKEKG